RPTARRRATSAAKLMPRSTSAAGLNRFAFRPSQFPEQDEKALMFLFVTQGSHGGDSRGAVGWDDAGHERYCGQQNRDYGEGQRVGGFYAVDLAGDDASERERAC